MIGWWQEMYLIAHPFHIFGLRKLNFRPGREGRISFPFYTIIICIFHQRYFMYFMCSIWVISYLRRICISTLLLQASLLIFHWKSHLKIFSECVWFNPTIIFFYKVVVLRANRLLEEWSNPSPFWKSYLILKYFIFMKK